MLKRFYRDYPNHKDGSHLGRGVPEDAIWQHRWHRLVAQSTSWYATPSGAAGHRFTAILSVEWQGVLDRSWNSERPLIFAHVVLTKTLGVYRSREIRQRIIRSMDLWKRVFHAGMVGYAEVEGDDREARATRGGE